MAAARKQLENCAKENVKAANLLKQITTLEQLKGQSQENSYSAQAITLLINDINANLDKNVSAEDTLSEQKMIKQIDQEHIALMPVRGVDERQYVPGNRATIIEGRDIAVVAEEEGMKLLQQALDKADSEKVLQEHIDQMKKGLELGVKISFFHKPHLQLLGQKILEKQWMQQEFSESIQSFAESINKKYAFFEAIFNLSSLDKDKSEILFKVYVECYSTDLKGKMVAETSTMREKERLAQFQQFISHSCNCLCILFKISPKPSALIKSLDNILGLFDSQEPDKIIQKNVYQRAIR